MNEGTLSASSGGTIDLTDGTGTFSVQSGTTFGCCPSIRHKVRNIQDNFAEYKYLIPNVSKDVVDVKVKQGYEDNPSIVKIEVDPEDVQDNEFVHGINETHQFDSLYDIDTLDVSYEDNVLTIRVDKRFEEQYHTVDLD